MIDSDYDEDDEYNQYEIDEIFSVSPTGTGDDDNGYDMMHRDPDYEEAHDSGEFDNDDIITPGGTAAIGNMHGTLLDEFDEDDSTDSRPS